MQGTHVRPPHINVVWHYPTPHISRSIAKAAWPELQHLRRREHLIDEEGITSAPRVSRECLREPLLTFAITTPERQANVGIP